MQLSSNSIPSIRSYEQALAEYEKRPDYSDRMRYEKGMSENEKPLSPYRHKVHLVIRKDSNGDIALRYHDTDVTTYHPNGDVTVEGWPSMSTNTFLEETTPQGMHFQCTDETLGFLIFLSNPVSDESEYRWNDALSTFRFDERMTLTPDGDGYWKPVSGTRDFEVPVFDRQLSRKTLKEFRFHEYRDWYHARLALHKVRPVDTFANPGPATVAALLADFSKWEDLAGCVFTDHRSEKGWARRGRDESPRALRRLHVETVRQHVLAHTGAVKLETVPGLKSGDLKKLRENKRKFAWMFD